VTAVVRGETIELVPLAREISARFLQEFPDERERYGDAGAEWCVHDNQWLLGWAAEDLEIGGGHLVDNVRWLARVLRGRGYPAERLVRDLELAGEVVGDETATRADMAEGLRRAADALRGG
jgi:hypothetical protein